jgi:hypothetical protein
MPIYAKPTRSALPVVLLIVALAIAFTFAIGGLVLYVLHSSEAVERAMKIVNAHPSITRELGKPVAAGWLITGHVRTNNDSGQAMLEIPISGPNGHASLSLRAVKQAGDWRFEALNVTLHEAPEMRKRIVDLIEDMPLKREP